ncbi:GNAT family N-acetyltransferase [Salinarimonas ramus]|uniref:BioF2-like acetyltransferase domain-containing protein n=1 Tax=Salinarimonas ramus TaxID=690164 RepID=A0A917Q7X7_9HYPH|nr:GNAT family N-acetyltransferase [Salinarimonas ramus]GGK34056.1 hypothetical protein GCM10011322_20930 [Salinarimonas ramus]
MHEIFDVALRSEIDLDGAAYRDLFRRAGEPCFGHPTWLAALARIFPASRGGVVRFLVVEERGTGRLALVLPLFRRSRLGVELVQSADFGVSDYTGPIAEPAEIVRLAADPGIRLAIARAVGRPALLRLARVRDGADDVAHLIGARTSPAPHAAHAIALPRTHAQWRESLSRSTRQALKRRRRQAEAIAPLALEVVDRAGVDAALERLLAFRAVRFPASDDALQRQDGHAFYREVARRGVEDGFVRIYALRHGERIVAVDYCIVSGGVTCLLLRGITPDADQALSFGNTLFDEIVGHCIASGDRVLDLAAGDEAYKTRFGAIAHPLAIVDAHAGPAGLVIHGAARSARLRAALRRLAVAPGARRAAAPSIVRDAS